MRQDLHHCSLPHLQLLKIDRPPHQLQLLDVVMVFSSTVIVVSYLVIENMYLHGLFHLIQLVCSRLQPVSCFSHMPPGHSVKKKKQVRTDSGKKRWSFVIILHVHCLCFAPCAPIPPGPCIGTCIRASVPCDAGTNSIRELPVVRNKTVVVLILPLTQYVATLPKLVLLWCVRFCIVYTSMPLVQTSFQLVEECLQVRVHVGECKLGTVCPEEAQQCFHAMLLGRPSWPAPLDAGFCPPSWLCVKSGSTKIAFQCLGFLNMLPSTSWK